MAKIHKTNAARALDRLGIAYEMGTYEVDESDLSAVHVARNLGADITRIYKTIVCECDGMASRGGERHVVACIQGDCEIDLKALARACGAKRCELIAMRDLERITGYIRGGCSPLAMKRAFATFIDERALACERIFVSAGLRGVQLSLAPRDLARATNAKFAPLVKI